MVCASETDFGLDCIGSRNGSLLVIGHALYDRKFMALGRLYDFGVANCKVIAGRTFLSFQTFSDFPCQLRVAQLRCARLYNLGFPKGFCAWDTADSGNHLPLKIIRPA